MTAFESFISGPLLTGVFVFFILGLASRLVILIRSRSVPEKSGGYPAVPTPGNQASRLLPFHKLFAERPLRVILLYLFHLSLVIVPIWYSGHISLWEASSLGWSWVSLPEAWSDWLTIGLLVAAAVLLLRRILVDRLRRGSRVQDYLWIVITALPFLSGYLLAHGSLDAILGDSLWTIHVLSGELLIVLTAFLFVRIGLAEDRCNGCASCAVECPAASLTSYDEDEQRNFIYDLFKCVKCGNCVRVCPESAAGAKHSLSLKNLFWAGAREPVRTVVLGQCQGCGQLISPDQLIGVVDRAVPEMQAGLCNECKQLSLVGSIEEAGQETSVFRLPDDLGKADHLESLPISQGEKR